MEKFKDNQLPVDTLLYLNPERVVIEQLDALEALPSERNRFFPNVLNLAGEEVNGTALTSLLLDLVDDFARAVPERRRGDVVKRMLNRLPQYIKVLMPEGEQLDDTINLYIQILNDKLYEEGGQAVNAEIAEDEPDSKRGAPRKIKKIMNIPEENRTQEQKNQLNKWLRQLGSRSLAPKQPSQRELAQRQAEQKYHKS